MSPKIHSAFWSDDDIWELCPEHKLAALWIITNGETNNAGYLEISLRQFTQDTRLDEKALEGAIKALPRAFVQIGKKLWVRHFMKHQWAVGERGPTSRLVKSLANAIAVMPEVLQVEALKEYPELYAPVKALTSPLKALPDPEGPSKALEGPRAEQSRAEHSSVGGAGGDYAEIPTAEEVHRFAQQWPGDMARMVPRMAPEWVPTFLVMLAGRQRFPRDWRFLMKMTWEQGWRDWQARGGKNGAGPLGKPASPVAEAIRAEKKLAGLEQQWAEHAGNPASASFVGVEFLTPELRAAAENARAALRQARADGVVA